MPTPLEKAILNTVAWFDMTSYPLTPSEIFRYLYFSPGERINSFSDAEILGVLEQSPALGRFLNQTEGYYHLRNRENIVDVRKRRAVLSENKMRIANKATKLISLLPFVRMVAVVNTVAYGNAREDSDVDLFIVIKHGRMFLTRWLITVVLDLFQIRRHGQNIQDRACLSWYVTNAALSIEPVLLQPHDPLLTFWLEYFTPLYSDRTTFEQFISENAWVREYLPRAFQRYERENVPITLGWFWTLKKRSTEKLLGNTALGHWLERKAKQSQMQRFDANTRSKSNEPGTDVVISDTVLKFHETDKRGEYREAFATRLRDFESS